MEHRISKYHTTLISRNRYQLHLSSIQSSTDNPNTGLHWISYLGPALRPIFVAPIHNRAITDDEILSSSESYNAFSKVISAFGLTLKEAVNCCSLPCLWGVWPLPRTSRGLNNRQIGLEHVFTSQRLLLERKMICRCKIVTL